MIQLFTYHEDYNLVAWKWEASKYAVRPKYGF